MAESINMYVRPIEEQQDVESRKLWNKVTVALKANDQTVATDEKFALEEEQRRQARDREENGLTYEPRYFRQD